MDSGIIFIVGMARTGTTLMARSLNKGNDIYFLKETHFMREYQHLLFSEESISDIKYISKLINQFITIQRKDYYRKSEYSEYPAAVAEVLNMLKKEEKKTFGNLLKCLFFFEAGLNCKIRPGDQTPNHVFYIDEITNKYPNSKFINMVRDPRAVILSQKNKWKASKRQKQPLFEIIRAKINYHPVTQSMLWRKAVDAGIEAVEKYGDTTIKTVLYENLVNEAEVVLKAVCSFADIEFCMDMLKVSVSMSSNISVSQVEGMDSSLTDRWKTLLSSTEIFLVELICGKCASRFGYNLMGVKPNYFMLIFYSVIFPVHIILAYSLSAKRFKNSFCDSKRLFKKILEFCGLKSERLDIW